MDKIKIAFLTPEYPHSQTGSSGGIGTSIKMLANALINKGVAVSVLVYGQQTDALFFDDSIAVYQIKNVKLKGLSRILTQLKISKLINRLYKENKIDVVEAADWTGITSFIQPKKCPIIIRLHGSDTYFCELEQRPVKFLNKFHEKRALTNANKIISVSQFTADQTNQIFKLNKPIQIINNGVNTTFFKNDDLLSSNNQIILYFGTLIRKKGVFELVEIFNKVCEVNSKAKLVLIGKDSGDITTNSKSTWELMKPLFSNASINNVSYLGKVSYDVMNEYINKATICVFPSFAEALPVSWLEAMAMKKAIVASNIGWGKEIIEDGKNGFLVDPRNHELYAEKILSLLADPNLRLKIGDEARKKIENCFDINTVVDQNIEFYNIFKR
jgi:glycosyltransferase involved in cell wall biosynthesis